MGRGGRPWPASAGGGKGLVIFCATPSGRTRSVGGPCGSSPVVAPSRRARDPYPSIGITVLVLVCQTGYGYVKGRSRRCSASRSRRAALRLPGRILPWPASDGDGPCSPRTGPFNAGLAGGPDEALAISGGKTLPRVGMGYPGQGGWNGAGQAEGPRP